MRRSAAGTGPRRRMRRRMRARAARGSAVDRKVVAVDRAAVDRKLRGMAVEVARELPAVAWRREAVAVERWPRRREAVAVERVEWGRWGMAVEVEREPPSIGGGDRRAAVVWRWTSWSS